MIGTGRPSAMSRRDDVDGAHRAGRRASARSPAASGSTRVQRDPQRRRTARCRSRRRSPRRRRPAARHRAPRLRAPPSVTMSWSKPQRRERSSGRPEHGGIPVRQQLFGPAEPARAAGRQHDTGDPPRRHAPAFAAANDVRHPGRRTSPRRQPRCRWRSDVTSCRTPGSIGRRRTVGWRSAHCRGGGDDFGDDRHRDLRGRLGPDGNPTGVCTRARSASVSSSSSRIEAPRTLLATRPI